MPGKVGVAPAVGEVPQLTNTWRLGPERRYPRDVSGDHLPPGVDVPGALLRLGDGCARQGEGEICGVALETAMNSVFVVDLVKVCQRRGHG
jgi:acetamidase/formamidase